MPAVIAPAVDRVARNAKGALQNMQPGGLSRWRAAVGRVRAGSGNGTIALVGDSTWVGANGALAQATTRPNGPGFILPQLLRARGINVEPHNSFFGTGGAEASGSFGVSDNRIATTGVLTIGGGPTIGGYSCTSSSAAAGTLTFTVTGPIDTIDVYMRQWGVAGTFSVTVNGGATSPATVSTGAGPEAISKQTVTCASTGAGTHTITLTRTAGQPSLVGMDAFRTDQRHIRVWNFGWSGSSTSAWIATTPTFMNPLYAMTANAVPDLAIINLGINDWIGGNTVAQYRANLDALVAGVATSSDVLLVSGFPTQNSVTPLTTQAPYVEAMRAVATARGVPFVDVWRRYGTWETASARGLAGTDPYHPLAPGYWDTCQAVAEVLL